MHNSWYILIPNPVQIPGKFKSLIPVLVPIPARCPLIPYRFRFQPQNLDSISDSDLDPHQLGVIPILIPEIKCMIPISIPTLFNILDSGSGSDSSQKQSDSGIDYDSGIGIVHHCL